MAQRVKNPVLSLLWLGSLMWHGNFPGLGILQAKKNHNKKPKKKKKGFRDLIQTSGYLKQFLGNHQSGKAENILFCPQNLFFKETMNGCLVRH